MKSQLLPFIAVAGLVCGCATTGYQRASEARWSIERARTVTANIQQDLDASVNALRNLTGPDVADLLPPYQSYSMAVKNLDVHVERLEPHRRTVLARQHAYVTAWKQELPLYQDADLRARSTQRRDEVIENIRRLNSQFHATQTALDPAVRSLKDLRRYLSTDLTESGVASVRDQAERITAETANARQQAQSLLDELDRSARELSPLKPTQ